MVVAHHIVLSVAKVKGKVRVRRRHFRRRTVKSGSRQSIVAEDYAAEGWVVGELPVQHIAQLAGEKQAVVIVAVRKALRVLGRAGVRSVAVKNEVVGAGKTACQPPHLSLRIRFVERKLPDIVGIEARQPFIPMIVHHDGRAARYFRKNPARRLQPRMVVGIHTLEGQGIKGRADDNKNRQSNGC